MLEKQIESHGRIYAKQHNQTEYKFNSMNRTAVPDRLKLAPIPEEHRVIVARYIRFVEYKQTGKKPTAAQAREHKRLRDLGFTVEVVDSVEGAKWVTHEMSTSIFMPC